MFSSSGEHRRFGLGGEKWSVWHRKPTVVTCVRERFLCGAQDFLVNPVPQAHTFFSFLPLHQPPYFWRSFYYPIFGGILNHFIHFGPWHVWAPHTGTQNQFPQPSICFVFTNVTLGKNASGLRGCLQIIITSPCVAAYSFLLTWQMEQFLHFLCAHHSPRRVRLAFQICPSRIVMSARL